MQPQRFAYETFVGPIPDGLRIYHSCGTAACVNAKHLFVGTALECFQAKIKVDPDTGCHLWIAALNHCGYALFSRNRSSVLAHRFAYETFVGPIPDGLHVLHRCDTPACVNIEHLFLGTHQDNMSDMAAKGRARPPKVRGERHGRATLTDEDVRAIRARWAAGEARKTLSRDYGVTTGNIHAIVNRLTWRHLP